MIEQTLMVMPCRSRYYKAILLKIPLSASVYALFWMPFNSAKGKTAIIK